MTVRRLRTAEEKADRERRKRLWLDPVLVDLRSPEARGMAKECHVSLRLVAQIAGLIVNLDSFIDAGYVYPSQVGIASHIQGANGEPISDRQVRRGIEFLRKRNLLRVENCRGTRNLMFPLYSGSAVTTPAKTGTEETMSDGQGHDVRAVRTSCPVKLVFNPVEETKIPLPPFAQQDDNVVRLTEQTASGPQQKPSFDEFYNACVKNKRDCIGAALAAWGKLSENDQSAIIDLVRRVDHYLEIGMHVCVWLKARRWENIFRDRPTVSSNKVFVEEDTEAWREWCVHYRTHGAPNGTHVAPRAFGLSDGRRGNYFSSATPPQ